MSYDPQGSGAAPDDPLVRRGMARKSATRLARQAALAAQGGVARNGIAFGHGVSVTSPEANRVLARDPANAVRAMRRQFEEAGFEVRYTPTHSDCDHHTIILPSPVTDEVASRLNTVLGRSP